MRNHLGLLAVAAFGVTLVMPARAQTAPAQPTGKAGHGFQGYWMGVDPVDGGDARRSLIQREDGKFALAARDTVLTLCGGTDRGFASFEDGELVMLEHTTQPAGSLVSTIVFHKVSQD